MQAFFWRCGGSKTSCEEAGFGADCCPALQASKGGWHGVAAPAIYSYAAAPHQYSSYAKMAILCDSAAEQEEPLGVQLECTQEGQPTVKLQNEVQCAVPFDLRGTEVPWNAGYTCNITVDASGSRTLPPTQPSSAAPQPGSSAPAAAASHAPTPAQPKTWHSVAIILIILITAIAGLLLATTGGARKGGYEYLTPYE